MRWRLTLPIVLVAVIASTTHAGVILDQSSAILAPVPVATSLPAYPPMARVACVQGIVAVLVVIAPDGTVTSADTLYGHPLLRGAASQAARQWRFQANAAVEGGRREVLRFLFRVMPWNTPRRNVKAVFRSFTEIEIRSYPGELTCEDCSPRRAKQLRRSGRCPSVSWPQPPRT